MSDFDGQSGIDEQPAPRWYCQRSNQMIGPLTTDEMLALIERRSLADYDRVRLDGTDNWEKVKTIRALLMEPPAKPAERGAAGEPPPQLTEDQPADQPDIADFFPQAAEDEPSPRADAVDPVGVDAADFLVDAEEILGDAADADAVEEAPLQEEDDAPLAEPLAETEEERHDAAHAASEMLHHMNAARLRAQAEGGPRRRRNSRGSGTLMGIVLDGVASGITSLIVLTARVLRLRLVQAALGIALIAGVVWGVVLPRLPVDSRAVMTQFQDLSAQMEQYRSDDATDYEWGKLEERASAVAEMYRERLRREASSRRPDLQELAAAAEWLAPAVREAQADNEGERLAAAKLGIHLANAERLLARREELRAEGLLSKGGGSDADPLFWGFVAVDAVLFLAVLVWIARGIFGRGRTNDRAPMAA